MARRGKPKEINWYLREWMEACDIKGRGAQAKMMKLTGWSKATMSQLYNNEQDYSPQVINTTASALQVEPYELLMRPEKAMAIRRQLAAALELAHDAEAAEAAEKEANKAAESTTANPEPGKVRRLRRK